MSSESNRGTRWDQKWNERQIGFHKSEVHKMLIKHFDKLTKDGKTGKVFVPLCGKSLDLNWLSEQGVLAIGIDIVPTALKEFFSENDKEYTQQPVPSMGEESQLFQSKDGNIKLYCGDVFRYNDSLDGKFNAIWDRASIVALDRPDVPGYVEVLRQLLNPGGQILLETIEYDQATKEALFPRHPPPHAMFEPEIRGLFEPNFIVDTIDEDNRTIGAFPAKSRIYLITKK